MTHRRILWLLAAVLLASPVFAQQKPDAAAPPSDAGVLVVSVQPGSPAEKAGVQRGDIILEANGTAVNDAQSLRQAIGGRSAGDVLTLKVRHGDAQKSLSVTVGTREGRPWIGILPLPGREDQFASGPGMRGYGPRGYGMMFPMEGAIVEGVASNGPAEKAGLKKGDLILSVDGTTVDERNALADLVSSRKVGDTITLSVSSWGQRDAHDVKVTLGKNPDKDAAWLGLQYLAAPARFGGPGMTSGVLVVQVTAESPAAKAGIETRDLLTKIDGKEISDPKQIVDAVASHKPGDAVTLTVVRRPDGKTSDLTVTLGKNPADGSKAWLGVSLRGFGPGFDGRGPEGFGPDGFGPGMRGGQNPGQNPGPNARTL